MDQQEQAIGIAGEVQPDADPAAATHYASCTMPTPVGVLTIVASDRGLMAVLWPDERPGRVRLGRTRPAADHPILTWTTSELGAYFAGTLTRFTVPLDLQTGTPFQRRVWTALGDIPFGQTRSYAELAGAIGSPAAVRAVGAANGRNPLSIVLPCHRVIGAGGRLTGFAGGLRAKELLLAHEGARLLA